MFSIPVRSAGSILPILWFALAASPTLAQYSYHYFKEPIAIGIDGSKVAVYAANDPDITAALSERGIKPDSVDSGPIRHWATAELPTAMRDASQISDLVRSAADAQNLEFVSPVFIDPKGDPLIVTPWILVCFNDDVSAAQAERVLADKNAGTILERDFAHLPGVYRLRVATKNGFETLELTNQLSARADVKYAEPDFIFTGRTDVIPNDAGFGNCWGHNNTGQLGGQIDFDMDTTDAWDITIGSPSVIVMIMDVGVQQDHPDINQIPGHNYTPDVSVNGGPANECDNHGTAVASCVSGIINNGIGTVGSAPGCKTISAKIGTSTMPCGTAFSSQASWVADALGDAWDTYGAKVTNSSFTYGQSATLSNAYATARSHGVVNFAAAGNGGTSTISYPANLNGSVNAVAALNRFGVRATFSQYGTGLDFSAPGDEIYMADRTGADGYDPGDYVTTWGTSFATPYTCGVAALVFSVKPNLTPSQLETILANTCVDLGTPSYDTGYGYGFVNANNAVNYALSVDTDAPTPNPMSFSIAPHPSGTTSIHMQATLATDTTTAVQYFFDYTSGFGGHDSGYQATRDYTDNNLLPNSPYNYRVKARDTSSPFSNETAYSAEVLASTDIETPGGVTFGTVTDTSIVVQASGIFSNEGFGSTGFYFEMTPAGGSGANQWVATSSATITGLSACTNYSFRVKARNFQEVETAFTAPAQQATTGCVCVLTGDINGDTFVNGGDIGGYVRVKLGSPQGGDNAACADFGNNDLDLDTAEFVSVLLGS